VVDLPSNAQTQSLRHFYGTPINFPLELNRLGDKLTGNFDGDKQAGRARRVGR
jgi:hypothetical protein